MMENFFSTNCEVNLGGPVVCSTQCLCGNESEKGEANCDAKYKVTVVRRQVLTAQLLFCEFTAPKPSQPFRSDIPSPKNDLGQIEVFPTKAVGAPKVTLPTRADS